uniref:Reverse transcriptase zinc-binding domain-containing protein n=1 Tax=Nelumbo nucifera TaxID=4432 RepID=A0A822ZI45_NELNU|nr:TPA_asm: hypothetical protein HUJ06_002533 [Nelumbo nucifera]
MAVQDRCLTKGNLLKRGMIVDNPNCIFCGSCLETVDHLFLPCNLAVEVWAKALGLFGKQTCFPAIPRDFLEAWQLGGLSWWSKILWKLVPAAVFWAIWGEGSACAFEHELRVSCET